MNTRHDLEAEIRSEIEADEARFTIGMAAHLIDPENVPAPEPMKPLVDRIEDYL